MLTEFGKEVLKTTAVAIVFALMVLWAMCADADDRGPPGWKHRPVCSAPTAVYTSMMAEGWLTEAASIAVAFWNKQLGRRVLLDGGRVPMDYTDGDTPGYVGIRAAPLDMVDAWRANPWWTVAHARNRLNDKHTCIQGTAIWVDTECVVEDPAEAFDGCRYKGDVIKTIVHEMGHALGLSHSKTYATVMYTPSSTMGPVWSLAPDTQHAVSVLYSDIVVNDYIERAVEVSQ